MPQMSRAPVISQNALLMARAVGLGDAVNSVKVSFQASAVHRRNPFHIVRVNTRRCRRVTRKGGFFMGWVKENVFETGIRLGCGRFFAREED
jgi:hypothetical protein